MTIGTIISLMRGAVTQVISMVAPVLGLALIVGLVVAIFQATTSIQEQTLTFVPKIIAVFLSIIVFGSWILNNLTGFMEDLWTNFSLYLG